VKFEMYDKTTPFPDAYALLRKTCLSVTNMGPNLG